MAKKKVLYHYMIGGSAGGSDTCLYLLLKHLDRSKFDIFLMYNETSRFVEGLKNTGIEFISIADEVGNSHKAVKKTASRNNVKKPRGIFREFIGSSKKTIKKIPQIVSFIKILKKYDIDIVHTNHYLTGDRAMIIAAKLANKPVVSHNRGLYKPDVIDRFISKYVDNIICMSDFSKSVYTDNGVAEEKCKTIYDGIEVDEFNISQQDDGTFLVGCFGRLEKWKGQQTLIDAAEIIVRKNDKVKFVIVGGGPDEDLLKKSVAEKMLNDYFEFTGYITNVREYMEKCSIIVHTSIEPEPFGMVITEAMALGKPVIATNFGGPVEIIDNEIDGYLIKAEHPDELAIKILLLGEDNALRSKIGQKAREKVDNKFNVKKYAKKIEEEYAQLF